MPQSSAFAGHLPANDLMRLDALARKRRQTRSQPLQEAQQALLDNDEDQGRHEVEVLRSAVEAQEALIEQSGSIADEHRRF